MFNLTCKKAWSETWKQKNKQKVLIQGQEMTAAWQCRKVT